MIKTATLYILLYFISVGLLFADTYPEVLFENSLMGGNYAYSEVQYQGPSWVENVEGRLPISDSIFFTPGNALSLEYTAGRGGRWQVTISYPDSPSYYKARQDDRLTFKLFVATATTSAVLPRIAIAQADTVTQAVNISKYISDLQANTWINVSLPLSAIGDFRAGEAIQGIQFSQGEAGQGTHRLYIDQIEFLPANPPRVKLSSPAVLSSVDAYDHHVDLTWQLPLTPSIRYIKIYRSEDNEHFIPVAVRPIFVQKCTDFVPQPNKTYYYKIAWVDYDYLESPFSNVLEAQTKTVNNEELLDFIQAAHLNYFLERTEVNSGMHAVAFGVDNATVSVKETGLSLLAQVVGASRGFVSQSVTRNRLTRILDFLDQVDRYHGAFPAFIDGRTHRGVFDVDSIPQADLEATAFLMQGLLVAQAYLGKEDAGTDSLSDRINALWESVEWNKFTIKGQEHILLDRWSPVAGFRYAKPLGGFNASLISYVLALASPKYSVVPEAYEQGLGVVRRLADTSYSMELAGNPSFAVESLDADTTLLPQYRESPYRNDTTLYGLPITVGSIDTSLLESYTPLLAFDPRNKRDTFADYYANEVNLIQAYQRRDNEAGNGSFAVDVWGMENTANPGNATHSSVINPAMAIGSYAFLPNEAIKSIRMFYHAYGRALFTEYGFRERIDIRSNAVADEYDALNQAVAVVMIENGRTGLIWDLFSSHPAISTVIKDHFTATGQPQ